jgi:hypothetical protein
VKSRARANSRTRISEKYARGRSRPMRIAAPIAAAMPIAVRSTMKSESPFIETW